MVKLDDATSQPTVASIKDHLLTTACLGSDNQATAGHHLEPVFIEGEAPGEIIEVVGTDDSMWNKNRDDEVIKVKRQKSLVFNRIDPEQHEKIDNMGGGKR